MDFFDAVRERHSIRKFQKAEIEQDKLDKLLETINSAPSAGNLQGYEVIVVRDQATKDSLAKAAFGQTSVSQAPVVLVFCADHLMSASKYAQRGAELYAIQDATIATAYAQLAATATGLATVWVGAFDPGMVSEAVALPDGVTPVALLPVGFAAEEPRQTPRRSLRDLVREERF
jgi:nitroreductase